MTVSLSEPSHWSDTEQTVVRNALRGVMAYMKSIGHPFHLGADPEAGYRNIMAGITPAVLVDGYLIVYDVGETCFSSDRTLFESLVLRVSRHPGNLHIVPQALETLARQHGCRFIAAGNAIGRRGLTAVYEASGFKPVATQLYKEAQWAV